MRRHDRQRPDGLCLSLIEEGVIDGVPALIINRKGDRSNLLLTFPNLTAEELRRG